MKDLLLQDYLRASVERHPGAPAVIDTRVALSHADLWELSGPIAHDLIERGLQSGERVCLRLPQTPYAVAAILGVLRTGRINVSLDPGSRADRQIQSWGYRIELGKIETALHALPYLDEVSVVAIPVAGFEGMQICCAHTPADVDLAELRSDLRMGLPAHMVPTTFLGYCRLPTNPHGKVDRKVLLVAFQDSPGVSWS